MTSEPAARQVLRGARVVDDLGPRAADVAVVAGRVQAVGVVPSEPGDVDVDCAGRLVLPGLIDAHSHADGAIFDDDVQAALLRQGVTSVVAGQDGVSYAPGGGTWATEYFAAINGPHPTYTGSSVADLLATYDGATRVNVGYLVPAGTVRWEVMGRSSRPADEHELARMVELVASGIREGAVGLSTGLDYVPGIFADAREIAALCGPVAAGGGIYVTHMRGGYEANSAEGMDEIAAISTDSGVAAHVSHFHADPDTVVYELDRLTARGVDVTFDAYPYDRGCTLLAMPLLPPRLAAEPVDEVLAALSSNQRRAELKRDWFPTVRAQPSLGPDWASMITFAHVAASDFDWVHGLTIDQAAERARCDPVDLVLDVLQASRLEVNAVMAVPTRRSAEVLSPIVRDRRHMGGSDGIFVGRHPHPRAHGTFARYLRQHVRERETLSWAEAVHHLSTRPARRFGLGARGRVEPGWVADLAVVDATSVTDTATYERPGSVSIGVDDVWVSGVHVLADGELSAATPGRGLRREAAGA